MKKTFLVMLLYLLPAPASAAIVYQNFEPDNGTPPSYQAPPGAAAEYGWGFNGAVVALSTGDEPVYEGKQSWKAVIPAGPPVNAGTTIPAQAHTYNVNLVPECHDRLTFWVWSDPSSPGDHTSMVKFFDQGKYKHEGIGIWTTEKAAYRQWTQLTVLFSQLPEDFNVHRVDKIEFFEYFDGTYYYDDVRMSSSAPPEQDAECLKREKYVACVERPAGSTAGGFNANTGGKTAVLGLPGPDKQLCFSVYGTETMRTLDYWQARADRREEGLAMFSQSPYGRL